MPSLYWVLGRGSELPVLGQTRALKIAHKNTVVMLRTSALSALYEIHIKYVISNAPVAERSSSARGDLPCELPRCCQAPPEPPEQRQKWSNSRRQTMPGRHRLPACFSCTSYAHDTARNSGVSVMVVDAWAAGWVLPMLARAPKAPGRHAQHSTYPQARPVISAGARHAWRLSDAVMLHRLPVVTMLPCSTHEAASWGCTQLPYRYPQPNGLTCLTAPLLLHYR